MDAEIRAAATGWADPTNAPRYLDDRDRYLGQDGAVDTATIAAVLTRRPHLARVDGPRRPTPDPSQEQRKGGPSGIAEQIREAEARGDRITAISLKNASWPSRHASSANPRSSCTARRTPRALRCRHHKHLQQPNFVGELFALTPTNTPFPVRDRWTDGGKRANGIVHTWSVYDRRAPAPNRQRLEGADAPGAETPVRGQDRNVLGIPKETVGVTYTRQAAQQMFAATGSAHPNAQNLGGSNAVAAEMDWQTLCLPKPHPYR